MDYKPSNVFVSTSSLKSAQNSPLAIKIIKRNGEINTTHKGFIFNHSKHGAISYGSGAKALFSTLGCVANYSQSTFSYSARLAGKTASVSVLKDNNTIKDDCVKLSDLRPLGIKVSYDSTAKIVTLDMSADSKVFAMDSKGLNLIANMERNLSTISYDAKTKKILSIPTNMPDVGYGHDVNQLPISPVPKSLKASEALALLKKDISEIEKAIATDINAKFTQNQFNALVSLRYNIGRLSVIDGLIDYLEKGSYERTKLRNLVNSHYDRIIQANPDKRKYKLGWYNRTEKFLDVFFNGHYGEMPIDAVNGKVSR